MSPYTSPTATNMPQRTYTNFPPPPQRTRPAPPQPSKTTFDAKPFTSGAERYANLNNPNLWSRTKENVPPRAEASSAWAHMKSPPSNQGASFGKSTRHTRANSFQQGPPKNDPPVETTPRPRSGREYFEDKPGFPNMGRANTTRVPKRTGFAPGTPGGDEPAARNTSSYFNTARAERQSPRTQAQYPPPPSGPPPTLKRPDPIRAEGPPRSGHNPLKSAPPRWDPHQSGDHLSSQNVEDPFANSERLSTPYATSGGERTYFNSETLNRSASSHSHNRNGWPAGYTPTNGSPLSTPGTGRHRSASPNIRSPGRSRSSSSSSSSEEDAPPNDRTKATASGRRASADHRAADRTRHPPNPSVHVEDEADLRPKQRSTWDSQTTSPAQPPPRDYPASQPSSRRGSGGSDPEGFLQHRTKHTERGQQLPRSPLHATAPWTYQNFEKPLEKSRSWQEQYGSKEEGNNQRHFERPPGTSNDGRPMYDSSKDNSPIIPLITDGLHNPSSSKLSTQQTSQSSWPSWAKPSSVTQQEKKIETHENFETSFPWDQNYVNSLFDEAFSRISMNRGANLDISNSFPSPHDSSGSRSPTKTQSAENINTSFSPSDWHGKFTGDAEDYLGTSGGGVPRGRTSPPKGRAPAPAPFRERPRLVVPNLSTKETGKVQMPPPPPPPLPQAVPVPPKSPSQAKFSEEQWRHTFKEPNWAFPPPPPIQSPRLGNVKRPKTPRKMSTANKRPTVPRKATHSATEDLEDEGDASNEASSSRESETSQTNGNSPMDIDPALTPPYEPISNTQRSTHVDPITRIIQSAIPPILPQPNGDAESDTSRLNLNELKDTAPFAPGQEGLKNLNEMKDSLPFPSVASAIPGQPSDPQLLILPNPPKAPSIPDSVTHSSWESYMAYMRAYMAEWSTYNTKMLAHFVTRQDHAQNKLGPDWMSAVGEEGYAKYMRGVEEDFRVRQHWDVSWEKHRDCLRGLGRVREKALKVKISV